MKAIMEDHHRQLSNLEGVLEAEKDRQAAALREKLRRRREEKEAELLRKQKEEVYFCTFELKGNCKSSYVYVP